MIEHHKLVLALKDLGLDEFDSYEDHHGCNADFRNDDMNVYFEESFEGEKPQYEIYVKLVDTQNPDDFIDHVRRFCIAFGNQVQERK